jgi:hypothetical protein
MFRNTTKRAVDDPKLPFDLKLEAGFLFKDLLRLKTSISDAMLAKFSKDLSAVLWEAILFGIENIQGKDYPVPADNDPKNIANAANYYPGKSDFSFGGAVFTNPSNNENDL